MKTKRSYTMGARAQAVEQTRRRILDALFELAGERTFPDISLDDVAREAGVSVQTVLRQFGSRAGLFEANIEDAVSRVTEERATPVGDIDAALHVIVDHYERRGKTALLMLAQEKSDHLVSRITERGRQMHRGWVEEVFAPYADASSPTIDLLVVATDVYTWKLLRHDRGLSRSHTEQRMKTLVRAVLDEATKDTRP
ncbi:TetR/AcrR family transcriptional regulator [Nocardioides panacisoli]|uniref:HTH tetR-type domain-containing protein n=1 Tax=Nocardioides panacisoli TaxID=627624 RepID=A0ABP7ISD5_9ACTN